MNQLTAQQREPLRLSFETMLERAKAGQKSNGYAPAELRMERESAEALLAEVKQYLPFATLEGLTFMGVPVKVISMGEQVEWEIIRIGKAKDAEGNPIPGAAIERHSEGAQTRFGLSRAREVAKNLGKPWQVVHYHTLVPPDEHEQWLRGAGKNWSP